MRPLTLSLLLTGLLSGCSKSSTTGETGKGNETLTPEEAKNLLPAPAGMPGEDLRQLGMAVAPPNPDNFDDVPLTLLFLGLHDSKDITFSEPVNPAALAKAISRSQDKGYGSVIQPEFITKVTCAPAGGPTNGTVSFKAEGLYEGKVDFTARRINGKWRIEEFRLPTDKVGVRLGDDGKWTKFKL